MVTKSPKISWAPGLDEISKVALENGYLETSIHVFPERWKFQDMVLLPKSGSLPNHCWTQSGSYWVYMEL